MRARPLTTTHYALLCLLSTGPASAYELVARMRRSVGAVWPRAESNLYTDLKRLAADELAKTNVEHVGRRQRTTFRITPAGRRILAKWLDLPGAAPTFECEALLKLAFATMTTKEAALAHVAVMKDHAEARLAIGRRLATEYVEGSGPLPERLHINAVMWRYLWDMHNATASWAAWAAEEIAAWPDTSDNPKGRRRGLETLRVALEATHAAEAATAASRTH